MSNPNKNEITPKYFPEMKIIYKPSYMLMSFENKRETKKIYHSEFLITLNYFMNSYSKTHPMC